jgi:phosphoglycolate phosphatase/pyrophosphatase PpaX
MNKKFLNNIKHVCFDLDGTLIDSYITIYKTTVKTLEVLNIPASPSNEDFCLQIGNHFEDIFRKLNIPVPDIEHFINIYKPFYFDFINDSKLYQGVNEVLDYLNNEGILVSLLTTKGQEQADRIIDHFNLRHNFSLVMGIREGLPIKPLPGGLLMICKELNILPAQTMMVGDTELDIRCGLSAGTKTCGVTYGYRTRALLQAESPDFIIDKIMELISL